MRISKLYEIKYILSNDEVITHRDKRKKITSEWEIVSKLSYEGVVKYLKLNKGKNKKKYKDVALIEIRLYDWVGNLIINKLFDINKK